MKKIIAMVLALFVGVVVLSGVTGCSGEKDKEKKEATKEKKADK